jgi:hypothetical protein
MPEVVVTASLFKHADDHFIVVVSTASAEGARKTQTDVRIEDAPSLENGVALRRRIVAEVVDRAERRGDQVRHVRWLENLETTGELGKMRASRYGA